MGKEILTFGDIEIEKNKTLPPYNSILRPLFFGRCKY